MKTLLFLSTICGVLSANAFATPPRTLLELAGVRSDPGHLSASVVVIIDAQREYLDGKLPLKDVSDALHQTSRLLARARSAHVPIIHIQQVSAPGRGIFDPAGVGVSFVAEAVPLATETVVVKKLPNAFAGTALDEILRGLGRKELIVSGYMTHMCVSATARSGLDHGYHVTVIADACATRDLQAVDGSTIPAVTVHQVALAELIDRFATVVPTLDSIPN